MGDLVAKVVTAEKEIKDKVKAYGSQVATRAAATAAGLDLLVEIFDEAASGKSNASDGVEHVDALLRLDLVHDERCGAIKTGPTMSSSII